MKLFTDLKARADGSVILQGRAKEYQFTEGEDGVLACVVDDEADVATALESGNFYPSEGDDDEAETILSRAQEARGVAGEGDDEADDLPHDPDAEPVEGKAVAKKPAAKKAARK